VRVFIFRGNIVKDLSKETDASMFVFITLIVSTQARHLNTWWS